MVEEKMKIGIDIDEVVVEFFSVYLKLFNERFGKNLVLDDIFKFEIWKCIDVSKDDILKLAEDFNNSEKFFEVPLVEGVQESLNKLNKIFDINFITSRPENIVEKTNFFLNDHFAEIDFNVYFSGGIWNNKKSKTQICKELGIKILIEDRRKYALGCAQEGIKVLLFDKPWNQNCEHKNMIRVYNWEEILEKIEEMKNAN